MSQSLITLIDLFGAQVRINFNGEKKQKSVFGAIWSILFYTFVVWAIYNESKDMFGKTNPRIANAEMYYNDPRDIFISSDNFPLAVVIQGPDFVEYKNESIFKMEFLYAIMKRTTDENGTTHQNWTYIPLQTEKCTPEYFGVELAPQFKGLPISQGYCISRDQPALKSPEMRLKGNYDNPHFEFIQIFMYQCDNATSEIPCAPQEVLDSSLSGGWFNIFYINTAIDPQNYSRPNARYRDVYYTMISPANYKNTVLELSHIEVTTDSGWLIDNKSHESYVKINKIIENFQYKPHSKKKLVSIHIGVSRLETSISRTYKKIQDVLSEFGGLANAILSIMCFLAAPYVELKVQEFLINELFNVNFKKQSKQTKQKINNSSKKKAIKNKKRQEKFEFVNQDNQKNESIGFKPSIQEETYVRANNSKSLSLRVSNVETGESPKIRRNIPNKVRNSTIYQQRKSNLLHSANTLLSSTAKDTEENHFADDREKIKDRSPDDEDMSPKRVNFCNKYNESFKQNTEEKNGRKNTNDPQEIDKSQRMEKLVRIKQKSLREIEDCSAESSDFFDEIENNNKINFIGIPTPSNPNQIDMSPLGEARRNKDLTFQKTLLTCEQNLTERDALANDTHIVKIPEAQNTIKDTNIQVPDGQFKKLNISIWEYIFSFIYKTNSMKIKMKLLSEGAKHINDRFDIIKIIKKLREVDKLKFLLLDPDHLVLFNNLPKPEIPFEVKEIKKNTELLRQVSFIDGNPSTEQVQEAKRQIISKEKMRKIDHKLLEIFNDYSYN